jgi:uncharacterized membrane protein YjjB (DUF3815 family)
MPGVALTNSARDMLAGDMVTGVARAADGIICALAIAAGTATITALWRTFIVENVSTPPVTHPLLLFFFYGALLTLGFSLVFHSPLNKLIVTSCIGGFGMTAFVGIALLGANLALAVLGGTILIAALAEIASRAGHEAVTVYIYPGIIPLVPGAMIYESMNSLLDNGIVAAASKSVETLICAGCIALGLVLVASMTQLGKSALGLLRRN